ncbi:Uncharacterised protein [Chromobacterium violaceum]|uniref:NUDIX domain n=1 Tax=Chromobacterium violaceum TaxID=536 RepID=A0A3S4HLJ6_CHRVL|nr:Uncharacterised protein [Chromobacterium violaceum]
MVLLTLAQGKLQAALHRRRRQPFQGCLALPGGYVHPEEDATAEDTARRVLREKPASSRVIWSSWALSPARRATRAAGRRPSPTWR